MLSTCAMILIIISSLITDVYVVVPYFLIMTFYYDIFCYGHYVEQQEDYSLA